VFEQTKRELLRAAAADLSSCSATELAEQMRELDEIELAAVAQRLRRLDQFDRVEGYTDDGQVTAAAWVRTCLGKSHGVASGRTSFRHLQATATAMRRLPQPDVWQLLDERITGWAQAETVAEYAEMLDELVEQLRPEPKPKDERQHDKRRLSVTAGFDGMLNMRGLLDPEAGEKFQAALSAASRPDAEGEVRSPGQRKADALEHVLDTVLDTALLPVDGGEKPHVTVMVDLDKLAGDPAVVTPVGMAGLIGEPVEQLAWRTQAAAAAAEAVDRQPRHYWTGPTSNRSARRLACDGILLPIFTRGGQPIDVGRRTRVINAAARAHVVVRDRRCQWKGCKVDARWCAVHHVQYWRDGGRTDSWNLILLCPAHHRAAHSGRWTVVLHGPGRISVRVRQVDDPYYVITNPDPPPPDELPLDELLTTAARHLRSA
jgi:hypothetical protein